MERAKAIFWHFNRIANFYQIQQIKSLNDRSSKYQSNPFDHIPPFFKINE